MRSWLARVWFSSILIFTSRTLPWCARTTFSRMGVSCLQGPHQGAQNSTSTGTCREASSTSLAKLATVAFLTRSPVAPWGPPPDLPNPNTMFFSSPLPAMGLPCFVAALSGLVCWSRHGKDARLVPAGANEAEEIVACDVGRRRILQRVVVKLIVSHHIGIENDRHAPSFVVDERERGDGPSEDAQNLRQQCRPCET